MADTPRHKLNPDQWIQKYADYLFNYAITRVDGQELAKDLVQETFFSGIKGKDNFRGQASERTWLISILKRKSLTTTGK
jgi:RNA polymerase sigma-70 factor (ECF subfamily)